MNRQGPYPVLAAEEAVQMINHGDTVAFSGFTPAGAAKIMPEAIAKRANKEHLKNIPYKIRVLTGASAGPNIDEDLAKANAISWRAPYQTGKTLRRQINQGDVEYVDMHLSHVPQTVASGFFGKIDVAVVEATEITPDGRVYLATSIGASPTYLKCADKVIIEINKYHSLRLRELADIAIIPRAPRRNSVPVYHTQTRIGWPYAVVDPSRVIGIVENNEPDHVKGFTSPDEISKKIAEHVVNFFLNEMKTGRIPPKFLPLQAGVGNVANSVMSALGNNPEIPAFRMYSEVLQNSMIDIMIEGCLLSASATSLTVTPDKLNDIVDNIDFFAERIVLRPQELSNHPAIIRRLGVIALNTALEVDIYGNVNSSHVYGMDIINGIGGSGEFTRNSHLSLLMTPSTAKNGKISAIVPMTPHVDNNEHSVQIVVTEQGLADLRGLGPTHRAKELINKCAHPAYKEYLERYVKESRTGHIRHDLNKCFELHRNLMEYGEMLPGLKI